MKKIIFVSVALIMALGIMLPLHADNNLKKSSISLMSSDESGKWVAVYGGGSSPLYCKCTKSFTASQCSVGDISRDLSLCEK